MKCLVVYVLLTGWNFTHTQTDNLSIEMTLFGSPKFHSQVSELFGRPSEIHFAVEIRLKPCESRLSSFHSIQFILALRSVQEGGKAFETISNKSKSCVASFHGSLEMKKRTQTNKQTQVDNGVESAKVLKVSS